MRSITPEEARTTDRDAIDAWKHALDQRCGLDRRQRRLIRETISRDLPCRDAIVCACMDPSLPTESLERMACDPQDDRALRDLARTLDSAFTRGIRLDRPALAHADRLLEQLADPDDRKAAQPIAISAYLAWMQDDRTLAADQAARALHIDSGLTLAGIVLAAIAHHVHPVIIE
ncbi:hypothetical protein [Bifidobacterium xylocopae]|uniref:DUF4192 domain-containing protein n=1 Tax=Bifidobacterium xylocopae TaxID=2493119 RepID=A0A366KAL5_9BIFI|nr:hypothetical protein [Bifidobacterium xylocopae]RBP98744.1 hypothetical protein CRD59_07460 [Bifidobacterium xylocopae]